MNIELVNAVAGGDMGTEIDLYDLASNLKQYSPTYEPEVSSGLHFKLPDTEVTVMIFSSGKYHLTGGNTKDTIRDAHLEIIDIIKSELGIKINTSPPEVRNLVFRGEFNREFDLDQIDKTIQNSNYNPRSFPGLHYSVEEAQMTIFRTGKFSVTGVTSRKKAKEIVDSFRQRVMS